MIGIALECTTVWAQPPALPRAGGNATRICVREVAGARVGREDLAVWNDLQSRGGGPHDRIRRRGVSTAAVVEYVPIPIGRDVLEGEARNILWGMPPSSAPPRAVRIGSRTRPTEALRSEAMKVQSDQPDEPRCPDFEACSFCRKITLSDPGFSSALVPQERLQLPSVDLHSAATPQYPARTSVSTVPFPSPLRVSVCLGTAAYTLPGLPGWPWQVGHRSGMLATARL